MKINYSLYILYFYYIMNTFNTANNQEDSMLNNYIVSPIYTITRSINDNVSSIIDDTTNSFSNMVSGVTDNVNTIYSGTVESINNTIEDIPSIPKLESVKDISIVASDLYKETLETVRSEKNILNVMIDSLRGNWFRIIMLVGILFVTMFLIIAKSVIRPVEQKEIKEKEEVSIKITEGMENNETNKLLSDLKNGLCNKYSGKSNELEKQCNKLSKNACNMTECCVYSKEKNKNVKCVAGDKVGPTFKYDDKGDSKNIEYYYYLNKCYGDKCV